ncbi:PREDICTED: leucine-rich repeat receptor protein kinase EMS1 [Nelumbo nucifera]|uniref:non-specific serine/threonine protein kinase n=2 Tax=Nelumbo nucifera TaxID=4432 RepID=A0A822Z6E8_NELNU|nr:PREDICTED: leucine-rich repeat receptor protein kinase EMS1 [Nelumbo nucifera]DAD39251.1 TPA_asm: hypothetical protein HUJ06_013574 [Nelumbo nucifera]
MSRYVRGSSLLLFFFSYLPVVLSLLPQNQMKIMANLNNTLFKEANPNPCSWQRVTCDKNNSTVISISLSGLGLSTSDILNSTCQIDSLQSLDVSSNSLSSIPEEFLKNCGKLNGLRALNFSHNLLSDVLPTFVGFAGLQSLDLSYNSLRGSISSQLERLVGLRSLNLSRNNFAGFVPTNLGNSTVLEELELSINVFSGPIPEELMVYKNLILLDLSGNNLSGPITERIGELSKLETLLLSSNYLAGEIPENLSTIQTLRWLSANQNKFSGKIPRGVSSYVKILDLSFNMLNGSIPSDFFSPPNLQSVDLSNNLLEGTIPTNISQSIIRLRLGSNLLNGTIPAIPNGTFMKLTYLELDSNRLSGEIPPELGGCKSLALLNLAQNQLTGPLPKELGNLSHLQVLKLQSNKLVGEIPDQLSQLRNLLTLNISQNSLTGSIPSTISSLTNLTNLNLNNNKLSGSLPDSIANLNSLLELQLGANELSGNIPKMPSSLQITLNLSRNLFEGTIPDTLAELSSLEVLDLSNNKFTGNIPGSLTRMFSLTTLLLSNNQLSGSVPKFRQQNMILETDGNKGLIFDTPATPKPTKKSNSRVVVAVIAVVCAVLAVGVIGVIFVLVSRRYHRINDEIPQLEEHFPFPRVIDYCMITGSSIHRSNIDFNLAMEAVVNPANIILKSRFSTYYKAVMPSDTTYYIKKLNWSDKIFQLGSHEKFREELEILGRLNNSNIMIPLAYVLTDESAYLFYEYAQMGTVFDVLHGNLGSTLDWESRYSIAVGVAQGLAFLHGCTSGPIFLLDLSTKSILLKSLKEPLVGDIELCKVIDPTKSTGSLSTIAGSVGFIPPEYAYTMRVTMPGNVYSFGVVLLELLTGKPAVTEGTELAKWVMSNSAQREKWDKILDPSISKISVGVRNQMLSVLKVALGCVSVSPEARPKMKNVLKMLLNAR